MDTGIHLEKGQNTNGQYKMSIAGVTFDRSRYFALLITCYIEEKNIFILFLPAT